MQFLVDLYLNRTIDFAAKNQFVVFSIFIFKGLIFAPLFIKKKWKTIKKKVQLGILKAIFFIY
jgi:hypothetical protein